MGDLKGLGESEGPLVGWGTEFRRVWALGVSSVGCSGHWGSLVWLPVPVRVQVWVQVR